MSKYTGTALLWIAVMISLIHQNLIWRGQRGVPAAFEKCWCARKRFPERQGVKYRSAGTGEHRPTSSTGWLNDILIHLRIKSHSESTFSFFAHVHDTVVQRVQLKKSVGGLPQLEYGFMSLPVHYIPASWTGTLFPLSHQHRRRPLISITLHFLSVLIQTRGSQLCLIAGKLYSTHMAVTGHVAGKVLLKVITSQSLTVMRWESRAGKGRRRGECGRSWTLQIKLSEMKSF